MRQQSAPAAVQGKPPGFAADLAGSCWATCKGLGARVQVVPACYRKNFPVHQKSHRSHDVLLLCFNCHEVAHKASEQVKRGIAG